MIISLIAAVADNGVIGIDGDLPWRLRNDMKHFMNTTKGHHILMGRKTFDSLGGPLKNRTHIIISRSEKNTEHDVSWISDIQEGVSIAKKNGEEELFVIGGAQIYTMAMDFADRLYITHVHGSYEGDTIFPEIDKNIWSLSESTEYQADEENDKAHSICLYTRK